MAIEDAKGLKPIIENAIKSSYGETTQNIVILRANQIPILDQVKESWRTTVEFDDNKTKYEVSVDIRVSDGSVKRIEEIVKKLLAE